MSFETSLNYIKSLSTRMYVTMTRPSSSPNTSYGITLTHFFFMTLTVIANVARMVKQIVKAIPACIGTLNPSCAFMPATDQRNKLEVFTRESNEQKWIKVLSKCSSGTRFHLPLNTVCLHSSDSTTSHLALHSSSSPSSIPPPLLSENLHFNY